MYKPSMIYTEFNYNVILIFVSHDNYSVVLWIGVKIPRFKWCISNIWEILLLSLQYYLLHEWTLNSRISLFDSPTLKLEFI